MAEGTTTVQALELQIKSNAMGASSSLTALATSLGKIKEKIAGGLNLGNVATEIGKFVTNLKSIGTNDDIERITKLTNSITGLVNAMKNLSGVKGGTAALKQAVDSTSAVKEYVGKHVGSEYVGKHENASYVGRHEAAGMQEAAQAAATVVENVKAISRIETDAADSGSKITSTLAESAVKAREAQMAILAMADALKGTGGGSGAKTEITIAQQALGTMLKYADDLYGSGQLNATAWRAVRQEIQGIDWGEGNPTSVMDPIEGKAWVLAVAKDAMSEMATSAASASESTATIGDGMAAAESKTETVKEEFHEVATAAEGAKASVDSTGKEAEKSASKLETLRSAVDSLKHSFKDLTKHGVLGFLNSMVRVAKYRMYRALIRNITEGFSTGLKNLREYSKAVDNLYNKDMTGLDNSLLKMKNSLGAVLGSAIQSLIPLFQQLSQWVITASNYINQFIALLSGRNTWTRAVDVVAADFEKTKKSAAGAAKDTKNLLAAWDELNIIQSQGGSGGGGSRKKDDIDYTKMFEEVNEFDSGLKRTVDWLRDNMGWLLTTVEAIGGAMLAWRIGAGLISSMAALGPIVASVAGTILGIVSAGVTVYLDWHFMSEYLEKGNYADLASANIVSVIGAALTGLLVGKGFNSTEAGLMAAGAVLTITGLVDIILAVGNIDKEGLNEKNLAALISGEIKSALGLGMFAASLARLIGKSKGVTLKFGQYTGIMLGVSALVATVATSVALTKGGLVEGEDGSIEKILISLATDAGGAVLAAISGVMVGGKNMGFTFAGATLLVTSAVDFAVGVGDVINNGVTLTNVVSNIKSSLNAALGAAFVAKGSAPIQTLLAKLGLSPLSLGAITFAVGALATLSLDLNTEAMKSESKADDILSAVTDAATSAALGIGVAKMTDNATTGAAAGGLMLTVDGVLSLIATLDNIKAEGFTDTNVTNLTKSAFEIAIGTGVTIGALSGNAILGIAAGILSLAISGIATALSFDVDEAIMTAAVNKLDWGQVQLTADEVKEYVKANFTDQKIVAEMEVLGVKLTELATSRATINTQVALFSMTLRKVEIGAKLDENTYNDLHEQLVGKDGIITKMQNQLKTENEFVALSLTVAPLTDENGNDVSAQFLNTIDVSSGQLGEAIQKIGNDISDLLTKSYQEGLTEKEGVWLETLTDVLFRVNSALNLGEAEAEFRLKVNGIMDFNKETYDNAVKEYAATKKEMEQDYRDIYNEQYTRAFGQMKAQEVLYDFYVKSGQTEKAEEAKKTLDDLRTFIEIYEDPKRGIDYLVAEAVRNATAQYDQKFLEQAIEIIGKGPANIGWKNRDGASTEVRNMWARNNDYDSAYKSAGILASSGVLMQLWNPEDTDTTTRYKKIADIDDAALKTALESMMYEYLPEIYGKGEAAIIRSMLDAGIGSIWDWVPTQLVSEYLSGYVDRFGSDTDSYLFNELYLEHILSLLGAGSTKTVSNTGTYAAPEVIEAIEETMEEGETVIEVGVAGPASGDVPVAPPGAPTYDESADDDSATETAQAEQTTVLRGMLTVLQQLLNKEVTARFVPSAAAGAAVQQAIRMAERMSG